MNFLLQLFGFLKAVVGVWSEISSAKNTPEMKQARQAQDQVDLRSDIEKAVAKEDTEDVRKYLAE